MVIEPKTQALPDHTQLPESDGTFVKNFQEHPQSILPKKGRGQRAEGRRKDSKLLYRYKSSVLCHTVRQPLLLSMEKNNRVQTLSNPSHLCVGSPSAFCLLPSYFCLLNDRLDSTALARNSAGWAILHRARLWYLLANDRSTRKRSRGTRLVLCA
ncbi:hypothetical protein NIES4073_73900 [Kalymmatonema gypsitolerans NIES-4073]|nr:hypothetical protein NIES4073_73900 [Scytonema sp. NIES-4073]